MQAVSIYTSEKRVCIVNLCWGRNDTTNTMESTAALLNCKLIVQSTRLCIYHRAVLLDLYLAQETKHKRKFIVKLRQTVTLFANEIYYIEMLFLDCLVGFAL